MTTTQIAIRLPDEQLAQLDEHVGTLHQSRSALVRRAIELYLYRLQCETDARIYDDDPLTDDELLADDADGTATMPPW